MLKNTCSKIKNFIKNDDHQMWLLIALFLFAVSFFVLVIIYIYSNFFGTLTFPTTATPSNLTSVRAEWGQIGDFFGGILNPLFGFSSLFALLVTIAYQARGLRVSTEELKLSREELSKSSTALASQNKAIELQSFEQTFFSWLSTYRELLNSISTKTDISQTALQGKEALYHLWENNLGSRAIIESMSTYDAYGRFGTLKDQFHIPYDETFNNLSSYRRIEIITKHNQDLVVNHIHQIWCFLYQDQEYQLDSLFRTAYKLIDWIDTQPSERLSNDQKWLYISIFRSQLSWIEMVFIFYNGLTGTGNKFKLLIEKYAFFDNLTFDSDIGIKIMKKHFDIENNYTKTAFNSVLARNGSLATKPLTTR